MSPRAPSDLMRLMYTSGTTDRPKGVMLSYDNMYWKSADQTLVLGLNAETRLLVVGPLYHVGALDLPGIAVLWHGGMLSIHRNFEPEQALAAIEAEQLNAAWFAPVMTTAILSLPQSRTLRRLQPALGDRRRRKNAGGAHSRLLAIFHQRPLHRRLRPDRNLRRRQFHGSRPRDRKDRIDRPRHRPCRDRDPRRSRQPRRVRRERRNLPARPESHARLLEGSGENQGRLLRRLVPHRRHRLSRRRRLPLSHRPQEGHDHFRRREYRLLRSRARHL